MGKTGFTDLAGGNLAIVFDVGLAHPVVAVVLGSSEEGRFSDMQKLVDRARRFVVGALFEVQYVHDCGYF
jgi:D-alanyl-D-alanine carboxypeptidase